MSDSDNFRGFIEKTVKKGKKHLYTAFIDFRKAYDKVNRKILLEKLKKDLELMVFF